MCFKKRIGYGSEFIKLIKILIKNLESRVISDVQTTPYFKLEIRKRQRDLISAFLFIAVLEVIFALINGN